MQRAAPGVPRALDAVIGARWPRTRSAAGSRRRARRGGTGRAGAARGQDRQGRRASDPDRALVALAGSGPGRLAGACGSGRRSGGGDPGDVDANAVAVIDPGKQSLPPKSPWARRPRRWPPARARCGSPTAPSGTVSRIDRRTRAVSQTIAVGSGPGAVAVGGGGVWVVNTPERHAVVDLAGHQPVVKTIPMGNSPSGVCASPPGRCGWPAPMTAQSCASTRSTAADKTHSPRRPADPAGLRRRRGVGHQPVVRDDQARSPRTRRRRASRSASAQRPSGLAWGRGAVWVTNTDDGTVSRIDGRSGVQTRGSGSGRRSGPTSVAVDARGVWVANERRHGGPHRPARGTRRSRGCRSATTRRASRSSTARCG